MMLDESMAVVASGGAVPLGRGQHGDQFREMLPRSPPSTPAAASSMARDHAATSSSSSSQQQQQQPEQAREAAAAVGTGVGMGAWRAISLAGVALGLVGTILGAVALAVASHHD
eukprot:COSAG01_NODE_9034_length_2575_cov_3.615105_2_plen_114_part_00